MAKKVLSIRLGEVDFIAGQVTFHCHLPGWFARTQKSCLPSKREKKFKLQFSQGKPNLRAACMKGHLEFNFFQPCSAVTGVTG